MALWLVRLVIAFLIWRGLSRLFDGIREGLTGSPRGDGGARSTAVALARDPVCGTYVVPSRALTAGAGDDTRFFCSDNCRRAFLTRAS